MEEKRYCVYFHKKQTDGTIYYIGSGVTGKREFHFTARSKDWHRDHESFGTVVEIYKDKLTISEARQLEVDLLLSGEYPSVINTKVPTKNKDIDAQDILKYIKYDESSTTFIRWIAKTGPRSKIGEPAGNLRMLGGVRSCSSVKINGEMYKISRLVWVIHNGEIPDNMIIDHVDGNTWNNNISNLRCIDSKTNSRNSASSRVLPSGIYESDVSFNSSVTHLSVKYTQSFSKKVNGADIALENCKAWRVNKLKELGILDSYTERHLGFNPEDYINNDFKRKSTSRTGHDNVWVKYRDGTTFLSAGIGRTNRKYVTVNDVCTYDEALNICLKYLDDLKQGITKEQPKYIYYEHSDSKYPRYRVAYRDGGVSKHKSFSINKLFPTLPFEEAKQKAFELAVEFRKNKELELTAS